MLTQPSSLCAFKLTIAATAVKTISALLIIPIIYIGWLAIALGIADGHAYDAKQLEKQWKKQDNFSQAVLADAITLSEAAVHWAPDHPDYLDQLSRYLTLRYLIDKDQGTAERVRALLLHARTIRPGWPGNWAAYIDIKHYTGKADADLGNAIVQGAHFGPWDPATIQAITQAGTANWKVLTPEAKNVVSQTIKRGLASPVPGLPMRTAKLTERGVSGWTIEFTQALTQTLVDEEWRRANAGAYIRLTLTLWPLLSNQQGDLLLVKMMSKSSANNLLKLARDSGRLAFICPRLPRTPRFNKLCASALKP
ncbi:MAG: hypothetical protein HOK91_07805 [Gammaproteobacteria bacterium]|nr:hypothetical protein [Gammaproteobacteria bacterium]